MGETRSHAPVVFVIAAFSRHQVALEWARSQAETRWGPLALESPPFAFAFTDFYERDMGAGLTKHLWAFERLMDPATLPEIKGITNSWERQYASLAEHAEPRPLNLDPGYLTEAKLVLASTKDRDHRIYLSQGIFAEGTLYYHKKQWQPRPWTYPDYRTGEYHQFFSRCRDYLRQRKREGPQPDSPG